VILRNQLKAEPNQLERQLMASDIWPPEKVKVLDGVTTDDDGIFTF